MQPLSGSMPASSAPADAWQHASVRSVCEINAVIQGILARMAALGYADKDQFAVRLAVEEAMVNAVKHGNRGDPGKQVAFASQVTPQHLTVRIEDEGPGFNPVGLPDPLDPANLERPGGRGVFLMRHYMTSVHFNERGNSVTLHKARSAG